MSGVEIFLLAGLAGVIYGVTKGFSFLLVAGMIYFLLTAQGLLLLRHWAWFTALCGFSVVLLFSLLKGLFRFSAFLASPDCMDCRWRDNLAFYRRSHETPLGLRETM